MTDRPEKLPAGSADVVAERREALQALFPEAFREGRVDLDALRRALGDAVETGRERYGLGWAGKADAVRAVQVPSKGTLVPDRAASVDFDTTQNVLIEGDNLEVLKLLQRSYHGQVKLIYIDPPYNTGKEFIYPDNFREGLDDYLRYSGQVDGEGFKLTSNTETDGRYHSKWLSMMWPRLFLARNLLREDGVIFVSIADHEVHNLRHVLDEVFGPENFVGTVVWKGATDNNPTQIAVEHEYIHCYAKQKQHLETAWRSPVSDAKQTMLGWYRALLAEHGSDVDRIQAEFRKLIRANRETLNPITHYDRIDNRGPYTGSRKVHNPKPGGYEYDVLHPETGGVCSRPANGYRYPEPRMAALVEEGRVLFGDDETQIVQIKEYLVDYTDKCNSVVHLDSRAAANELARQLGERKVFTNPKPTDLLARLFGFVASSDDLVLDFFAGSGTTGDAVMRLNAEDGGNRRYILVQLPEPTEHDDYPTIADITKARLRAAGDALRAAREGQLDLDAKPAPDLGFKVFKLAASNFQVWDGDVADDALGETLQMFADNVRPEATDEALLVEIMLRAGIALTEPVEPVTLGDATVYRIQQGHLLVCLAQPITQATLRAMMAEKPEMVVCLDRAFEGNDQLLTNTVLEMRSHGIQHFRTV
ncbi:MAG: site-specific DNA-methyltransferase [Myxococcales bacterium]|nr:site-specific DNA-methyltransferase [Myxococcales bacterium]